MATYTVQRGDSLFKIAQKFYGDGELFHLLATYNGLTNPNALEVGQVLRIAERSELGDGQKWQNYAQGTIHWRISAQGVEIQGQGILKTAQFTAQARKIWKNFREPILTASRKHGVPAAVMIATISTESSGKTDAYRYEPAFYTRYLKNKASWTANPYYDEPRRISASYGLMQIMYTTAYSVGFRGRPEDLYEPEGNLDAGAAYIAGEAQVRQHGWNPPKIACAYNAGSIRPTTQNAWGMYHHPGHLERWIPAYNAAVELLSNDAGALPEVVAPPITNIEPPSPQPPRPPAADRVSVQFLFPRQAGASWQPVIVDLFQHDERGLNDPQSFTIEHVKILPDAFSFERAGVEKGIYDIVFTNAATSSVIHDLADYEITMQLTQVDIREQPQNAAEMPQTPPKTRATLRLRFPAVQGQPWKPVIIDMFDLGSGGGAQPTSYTVKIPEYAPDGGYMHEIAEVAYGTYDFVFTDAATHSVIGDIAGFAIREPVVILKVDTPRIPDMPSQQSRAAVSNGGFGDLLKAFWKKLWG